MAKLQRACYGFRGGGKFVATFRTYRREAAKTGEDPTDEQLFDKLERDMGVTVKAPVCLSAVEADYVSRCCE